MKKMLLTVIAISSLITAYSACNLIMKIVRFSKDKEKLNPIVRLVRNGRTFCSGTVVNSNTIITAAHCILQETPFGIVLNSEPIDIRADNNIELNVTAAPIYATNQMDQAVLKGNFQLFDPKKIIANPYVLSTIPLNHTNYKSCGYPLGGDLFCTETKYEGPFAFMWKMKGVLLPGMSGGPTMLMDGTVVAINDAATEDNAIVSPIYNIDINF